MHSGIGGRLAPNDAGMKARPSPQWLSSFRHRWYIAEWIEKNCTDVTMTTDGSYEIPSLEEAVLFRLRFGGTLTR